VGKVPVFGLLKRGGKVYTQIIANAKSTTLIPIIEKKVIPDSIVYSDCWKGYNTLDVTDFKHYRINHSKLFADRKNPINVMGLRIFGIKQRGICENLMVYRENNFSCF
jgi:transposase